MRVPEVHGGKDCGEEVQVIRDKELADLEAEWRRKAGEPPRLLTPLPWRVRLRLAFEHAIDHAAIRLVGRKRYRAAGLLWRMFRMW